MRLVILGWGEVGLFEREYNTWRGVGGRHGRGMRSRDDIFPKYTQPFITYKVFETFMLIMAKHVADAIYILSHMIAEIS